jgi:hypothetical protein
MEKKPRIGDRVEYMPSQLLPSLAIGLGETKIYE